MRKEITDGVHRRDTMKAIVQETYGSPDVLQLREIDTPDVGDDEVLVQVHAAGSIRVFGTLWRGCRTCIGSRVSACARPRTLFPVLTWREASRRSART
jgi:hypothetical protein